MAASTAPLLAAGGIVLADKAIIHNQGIDWKIIIATGLAVGMFALAEPAAPEAVKLLSYLVVVGALMGKPGGQSPVQDFVTWFNPKPTSKGVTS